MRVYLVQRGVLGPRGVPGRGEGVYLVWGVYLVGGGGVPGLEGTWSGGCTWSGRGDTCPGTPPHEQNS